METMVAVIRPVPTPLGASCVIVQKDISCLQTSGVVIVIYNMMSVCTYRIVAHSYISGSPGKLPKLMCVCI